MKRKILILLLPLLAITSQPAATFSQATSGQTSDKYADKLRLFEEFARRQIEMDKTPGITIGFYKDDYAWVKGFGYADLENKVAATANSAYRLASATKNFTGVAIWKPHEPREVQMDR